MQRLLFFVALLVIPSVGLSQLDNHAFEDRRRVDPGDSNKLFLGVNMLGFGKNNEYDNTIIEGYTLFGYQFNPYLSYQLNTHFRLDAGVYLQKDFGNPNFTTTAPTLSLKYQKKNFALVFGNIDGSLNHHLIEPLYDFERVLNNRLENGLQLTLNREDVFLDLWVDWRKMIYVNDPGQEHLTAGLNYTKRIFKRGNTEFWLPVQVLANHMGGQINYQHLGPIETLFNTAIGGEIKHNLSGFVRQVRVNGYYVYYETETSDLIQPFKDGSGAYFNATASTKFGLDVMTTYWRGHEFISFEGGKIYPSVSAFDYTHQQHVMSLLIFRFLYTLRITDALSFSGRAEPYFDFSYGSFQYSYGFYLNYRDRFQLWKRK
jgi:hypothetical protein